MGNNMLIKQRKFTTATREASKQKSDMAGIGKKTPQANAKELQMEVSKTPGPA
jgi:hypothetical protein